MNTSTQAYHETTVLRQSLETQIFLLMLRSVKPWNIREISQAMNIDKSCASARLNKLKKETCIEHEGRNFVLYLVKKERDKVTNKLTEYWGVKLFPKQLTLL